MKSTGSNDRIILVDDDPSLLRLLSLRLTAAGFDVQTVESGEEALARISVYQPQIVVTDLRMGGMDGMALFDALHNQYPTLPVIILTAHGTIQEAVDATKRGIFSFLTKPFNSMELLEHIHNALRISGGSGTVRNDKRIERWRAAIITQNPIMEDLLRQAKLVAQSEATIFIQGESGTGKELLAQAVHTASPRHNGPFVAINCSAFPETLLESELFGYRKGAFTGATHDHHGLFQAANGGTLFLDEIGDMPKTFQSKLLRAVQDKQVRPVGGTQSVPVDTRIISATHRNIEEQVEEGAFREDLYYRLNVVRLVLPPLSQRREDIPLLATSFIATLNNRYNNHVKGFSTEAMERLVSYDWPGNVRQLHNTVEQVMALATTPIIPLTLVEVALRNRTAQIPSLVEARQQFERNYLVQLLQLTDGNVSQAARLAKRNRTEFYKLLKRHHLEPTIFKAAR